MVIAWCVFIILILFMGVLVDLIAQHDGIRERTLTHHRRRHDQSGRLRRDQGKGGFRLATARGEMLRMRG